LFDAGHLPARLVVDSARLFVCHSASQQQIDTMIQPSLPKRIASARSWLGLSSVLIGLLLWWLAARTANLPAFILPSPMDVWLRFLGAVADGSLLLNTGATLLEILLGLFFGVGLATILGYLVAKSRTLERVVSPYLVASQAVPLVAIAPLLVIWFGPGMFSKVLICALIVFFPVLVNTVVGVRAVPPALHDLMRSLHASRMQILVKLEVPAALPVFLGGLRIGATLSVIGAVVGELVGSDRGLGFLINVGRGQYDTALVFVAVFVLIALALCLYGVVAWMEARTLTWQEWRGSDQ
jgi:NitT/TauT family transport system permease protein